MTANDLISAALKTLGVLASGETADGDADVDGLNRLNAFVDALGTERLSIGFVLRTVQTLTANTTSYTIGSGGAINIARPVWIERAGLIIDSTASTPTEIALKVFTDQEWQALTQKTLTAAMSSAIYYDHGWTAGLGIVYPWPVPTVGTTQLVLYTPQATAQFATPTTDYTFPPAYERMLRLNLALELAPEYGAQPSALLVQQAADAMAQVKRANFRMSELSPDASIFPQRGIYSIYTDGQ